MAQAVLARESSFDGYCRMRFIFQPLWVALGFPVADDLSACPSGDDTLPLRALDFAYAGQAFQPSRSDPAAAAREIEAANVSAQAAAYNELCPTGVAELLEAAGARPAERPESK